jgi:hypothetical protein
MDKQVKHICPFTNQPPVDIDPLYHSLPQKTFKLCTTNAAIPVSLTHVVVTKNSLEHVFNMGETKGKYEKIKHKALSGYHLLNEILHDNKKVYRFCLESIAPFVLDGYIVNSIEHLPTYKTFFTGLCYEEAIRCLEDSLLNISSIEDQDKKWKIEGTSLSPLIHITSIVSKDKLELVTFYPTSTKSKDAKIEFDHREKSLFVRYFCNPCYLVLSAPDDTDSDFLHNLFGIDGMEVQLKFVHMDARSIDSYVFFGLLFNNISNLSSPTMHYGLLPSSVVDNISNDLRNLRQQYQDEKVSLMRLLTNPKSKWSPSKIEAFINRLCVLACADHLPDRCVTIINLVNKIYLPIETIQKVFFDGSKRFPDCLSKTQIVEKLIEAINNYIQLINESFEESVWEDIDSTKWCESTNEDLIEDPLCPSWLPMERDSIKT